MSSRGGVGYSAAQTTWTVPESSAAISGNHAWRVAPEILTGVDHVLVTAAAGIAGDQNGNVARTPAVRIRRASARLIARLARSRRSRPATSTPAADAQME